MSAHYFLRYEHFSVRHEVGSPDLKINYNHNPSSDYGEVSKMLGHLANLCLNQILLSLFFQEGQYV